MDPQSTRNFAKIRFYVILLLILLASLAFITLLWGFALRSIWRPHFGHSDDFPHHFFTHFTARNELGQTIHAWYASGSANLGVILLCHGHGVDHTYMADMVEFVRRVGFGMLLLDFRAHGISEGEYTSIGLLEWADIRCILDEAVIEGLLATNTRVAAYGRSMGAATLINGAAQLPEIRAFVLESPFAELRLIGGRDFSRFTGLPDSFLIDIGFHLLSWWTKIPYLENRPISAVAGFGNRPVLLIHDTLDVRATRTDHDRLKAAIPQAREMIVQGAHHVQAHKVASATFEAEFLAFLRDAGFPIH